MLRKAVIPPRRTNTQRRTKWIPFHVASHVASKRRIWKRISPRLHSRWRGLLKCVFRCSHLSKNCNTRHQKNTFIHTASKHARQTEKSVFQPTFIKILIIWTQQHTICPRRILFPGAVAVRCWPCVLIQALFQLKKKTQSETCCS